MLSSKSSITISIPLTLLPLELCPESHLQTYLKGKNLYPAEISLSSISKQINVSGSNLMVMTPMVLVTLFYEPDKCVYHVN